MTILQQSLINDLTVAPVRLDVPYAYLILELILYSAASSIRLLEGDLYALCQRLSKFIQFKYFIYTWLGLCGLGMAIKLEANHFFWLWMNPRLWMNERKKRN